MNTNLTEVAGVGPSLAEALSQNGFRSVEKIANTDLETLCQVPGIGFASGSRIIEAARQIAEPAQESSAKSEKKPKPSGTSTSKKPKSSKKGKASKKAKAKKGKKSDERKESRKKSSAKKSGKKKSGKKGKKKKSKKG